MKFRISSCKDCVPPKRHPGCHDHCEAYQAERERLNEQNAAFYVEKRNEGRLTEREKIRIAKAKEYRRKAK